MPRTSISFFIMNFILLFVAISFILIIFDLHRLAFVFELGILLIFILLLIFAMFTIYHNKPWGWTILGATLILLVVNTFFILLLTRTFGTAHITINLFSFVGLIISMLNLRGSGRESDESRLGEYEKVKDYYPYIDKMEPK